jgi:TDG/mug DNA glycosylase family protein
VDKLPDYLALDLRVVFCGTAVSARSAEVGGYYAGPGNEFEEDAL